jgi:6,7-dimethyl-8-ribityllumazine synthase
MEKVKRGNGEPLKLSAHVLIVEARFYEDLSDELARGAVTAIEAAGSTYERLAVPGALEVAGTIVKAHRTARYDGYVALGVVLRGETTIMTSSPMKVPALSWISPCKACRSAMAF